MLNHHIYPGNIISFNLAPSFEEIREHPVKDLI
jgi:hypothetical protein